MDVNLKRRVTELLGEPKTFEELVTDICGLHPSTERAQTSRKLNRVLTTAMGKREVILRNGKYQYVVPPNRYEVLHKKVYRLL